MCLSMVSSASDHVHHVSMRENAETRRKAWNCLEISTDEHAIRCELCAIDHTQAPLLFSLERRSEDTGAAGVQYFFGEYGIDADRRELRRGSELVSLGPQSFDLLIYLISNRERVVTKDD